MTDYALSAAIHSRIKSFDKGTIDENILQAQIKDIFEIYHADKEEAHKIELHTIGGIKTKKPVGIVYNNDNDEILIVMGRTIQECQDYIIPDDYVSKVKMIQP